MKVRYRKVSATLLAVLCFTLAVPITAAQVEDDRLTNALDWIVANYEPAAAENPAFYTDTIFALDFTPGYEDTIEQAAESLIDATGYYGEEGEAVPPALAKTIVALQVAGIDPTDVDGRDLVAELADSIVREGPETGRVGATDDVYAAAFAIMAFNNASIEEPTIVDWLADQQCPNGAFSYNGTCEGDEEYFGVDPDSTVIAVHGLQARPDAAEKALIWVADQQDEASGGFASFGNLNANSTGMGGLGMTLLDRDDDAARAADYILTLQFGPDSEPGERGGIRYQDGDEGPDFFATVQGVLAWAEGVFVPTSEAVTEGEACPTGQGVTVVVDASALDAGVRVSCATEMVETGIDALTGAGFEVEGTRRLPTFVCRIDGQPSQEQDPCVDTPPAAAFWGYWHAERGGTWQAADLGAASYEPEPGSVEGWTFGGGEEPSVTVPGNTAAPTTATAPTTSTSDTTTTADTNTNLTTAQTTADTPAETPSETSIAGADQPGDGESPRATIFTVAAVVVVAIALIILRRRRDDG